jgi:enediyne biosynthesis protein E4
MDLDHHGWQDLFIADGHAIRFPTGKAKRQQLPVLMRNLGTAAKIQFKAITEQGGPYFQTLHCARGVAFGDLDNDGRIDMVVCHLNEPTALVANVASVGDNHWLGVELHGKGNRSVVGAKLTLQVGDRCLSRFAKGGGSYASSNDPRLVFGVGAVKQVGKLTVTWPMGKEQTWEGLALDRYWKLTEEEPDAK